MIVDGVQMPDTFFTADRLAQFWGYVRWFLKYNMPIFMIVMAAFVAWLVLDMIIDVGAEAKSAHQRDRYRRHDDDDDDD